MTVYTFPDLARILSCSESFLRKLVARGELRAVKMGRLVRFREEDVRAYLAGERPAKAVTVVEKKPFEPTIRGPLRMTQAWREQQRG
jgi:excisionase family DNA binding protein